MTLQIRIRQSLRMLFMMGATAMFSVPASGEEDHRAETAREIVVPQLFDVDSQQPASRVTGTRPEDSLKMSAKERRQERAIYRRQQRTLRREYQRWMGYEPLRPSFNAIPSMSSRYGRPTIYVPVYVH